MSDEKTSRLLLRLLGEAYDDAAKAGLPARNPELWGEVWVAASRPWITPEEEFAGWLNEGPKLAKAAGCHVGIKVTEDPARGTDHE